MSEPMVYFSMRGLERLPLRGYFSPTPLEPMTRLDISSQLDRIERRLEQVAADVAALRFGPPVDPASLCEKVNPRLARAIREKAAPPARSVHWLGEEP